MITIGNIMATNMPLQINIGMLETTIGIVIFIGGICIAWGRRGSDVKHLEKILIN